MRVKSAAGHGNGESVLSIASASFDALVAENALGVIANVEIIVDLYGLMDIGRIVSVAVKPRFVAPHVRLGLWSRGQID